MPLLYMLDCGHLINPADAWRFVDDDGYAICHNCRKEEHNAHD
jgi:hypothetical protein